jgi:RNA polymerase sigma-70 factor (ECF subfamily)
LTPGKKSPKILAGMKKELSPSEEFLGILEKFSAEIKAAVLKFDLQSNGVDPDDILQEIRTKLWKKFSSEKKIPPHASYINRVVNNALIDYLRRARFQAKVIGVGRFGARARHLASNPSLPDEYMLRKMIGDACETLVAPRRRAVELFLTGMALEEIAGSLGWSEDKARNLVYRGLSDVKKKLQEGGIAYEN